jgi:hypothetical protein
LHRAASVGHRAVAEALLRLGAVAGGVLLRDKRGVTAAAVAQREGFSSLAERLHSAAVAAEAEVTLAQA